MFTEVGSFHEKTCLDLQPEKILASDIKIVMDEVRVAKGTEGEGLGLGERGEMD